MRLWILNNTGLSGCLLDLLQLLLLQDLLQSSLSLAIQLSSCLACHLLCRNGLGWRSVVAGNVVRQCCSRQLLVLHVGEIGWQDHLLLKRLNEHLILAVLHQGILLLELLLRCHLLREGLVFFEEVADGFGIGEIDHVVLVAAFVPSCLLVWSVSPVSVNSEFVHALLWVEEFDEVVSGRLLVHPQILLSYSKGLHVISGLNFEHSFSLPVVEMSHDFDDFATERPLENVFNF